MNLNQLLVALRATGWTGSGDDAKDKKRIYASIYNKPEFEQEDGVWDVKDTK